MRKSQDLVGVKFGRLLIISKIGALNKSGSIYWECKCECGNVTKAHTAYLINGRKASCGCIRVEKSRTSIQKLVGWSKLPEGVGAFNSYYHQYKTSARYKNIDFNLTKEAFFEITQKSCFYCNEPPNTPHCKYHSNGKSKSNGPYISNGIDRIDSNKGYSVDNMVPCCRICNIMKQELSICDFISHIKKVFNNIQKAEDKI